MLKIGTVYRMPKEHQPERAIVDGLPNYYFETNTPEYGFDFQKGIHKAKEVEINKIEKRCPLIIISSTPRKAGSEDTPWHDRYVPDHGYVKYYGDNKYGSGKPEEGIKLDVLVAQNVRIRCSALFVFTQKLHEDIIPVFLTILHYRQTLKQLPPTNSLHIEFLGSIELSTLTK